MYLQQHELFQNDHLKDILTELEMYSKLGTRTQIVENSNVPYFINKFRTVHQRQAHHIHEVSYRACFKT